MPAPAVRNRKIAIVFAPVQDHVPVSNIRKPIVAAGIALAVALAFACTVAGPLSGVSLALAGIVGAIFLAWSVAYTTRHHEWLLFALLMIEVLTAATAIPANVNTAARYGLEALFCLPIVPAFARSGLWRKGGFRLFLMYLGWALITVSFSLAPMFSLGRIFNTVTLFTALCLCASEVHDRRDLDRLVRTGLLACTLLVALIGISAVVLPSSQIWENDVILNAAGRVVFSGAGGMLRFQGFLNQPNELGEVMLTTIALALVYWTSASRREKLLLVPLIALACGFTALADSRTSAAGALVGVGAYIVWKYRIRGLLACAGAMMLVLVVLTIAGHGVSAYFNRGDVTTFTGRSEVWAYTVEQIKNSPWFGHGYEVEGAILDRKFPLWYGPWDDGPHSSLHENYLARTVGVGIPAALLWLFIMLRPWLSLFREEGGDPLDLKRIGLVAALPVFVLNFAESSAADCRFAVGILMVLTWALAEIHRLTATAARPRVAREFSQPGVRSGVLSGLTSALARSSLPAKVR
jgi:O-antigen ligase